MRKLDKMRRGDTLLAANPQLPTHPPGSTIYRNPVFRMPRD